MLEIELQLLIKKSFRIAINNLFVKYEDGCFYHEYKVIILSEESVPLMVP